MAAIRSRDTRPELMLRRGLHALGFRYRLHGKGLPGRPDMVFVRYRAVLFVHGCFWHGHGCARFHWPRTREAFWRDKIGTNIRRDQNTLAALQAAGWRTGIIWECALTGPGRQEQAMLLGTVAQWLRAGDTALELAGHGTATIGEH